MRLGGGAKLELSVASDRSSLFLLFRVEDYCHENVDEITLQARIKRLLTGARDGHDRGQGLRNLRVGLHPSCHACAQKQCESQSLIFPLSLVERAFADTLVMLSQVTELRPLQSGLGQ